MTIAHATLFCGSDEQMFGQGSKNAIACASLFSQKLPGTMVLGRPPGGPLNSTSAAFRRFKWRSACATGITKMRVTLFPCGPAANDSELKAFQHLKARLMSEPGEGTWV